MPLVHMQKIAGVAAWLTTHCNIANCSVGVSVSTLFAVSHAAPIPNQKCFLFLYATLSGEHCTIIARSWSVISW